MTTVNKTHALIGAAIATPLLMLLAMAARADGLGAPVTVQYKSVDSQSPAGAALLYKRIHTAADSVCAPLDHGDALSKGHLRACVQELVSNAVATVNTPALRALYAAQYGTTAAPIVTASR